MSRNSFVFLGILLMAGACSSARHDDPALGITSFVSNSSDAALEIVGRGKDGEQIAQLLLSRGHVSIPAEQLDGEGRTLTVQVLGASVEHKSVGLQPITLPLPSDDGIHRFLENTYVSSRLAQWGVGLTADNPRTSQPLTPDERTYATCTYGFSGACGETSCCQANVGTNTYEDVCCGSQSAMVERSCASGGTSACGTNGPLGCAVCWSTSYSSSCAAATLGTACTYTVDGTCDCGANGSRCGLGVGGEKWCASNGATCSCNLCIATGKSGCTADDQCCSLLCNFGTCAPN